MELLSPDWKQLRPIAADVEEMCGHIDLTLVSSQVQAFDKFIKQVRESHSSGGAYLTTFDVGADQVFDWFASRNRLTDEELLDSLLLHPSIRQALPELFRHLPQRVKSGLVMYDPFLLDGTLSRILFRGGAHSQSREDGRAEKVFALNVCEAMFGLRYGEVSCYLSNKRWTRWFKGEAWDVTVVVFDRRTRRLWILAITDTD
jgi:hypothetical protein